MLMIDNKFEVLSSRLDYLEKWYELAGKGEKIVTGRFINTITPTQFVLICKFDHAIRNVTLKIDR